tara:strand:+ start:114554 stop:115786 length:1233 start_codon:yes stop_codon:yes gene_type:complete
MALNIENYVPVGGTGPTGSTGSSGPTGATGSAVGSINDLTDVDTDGTQVPSPGDVLIWGGSVWSPGDAAASDLASVLIAGNATGALDILAGLEATTFYLTGVAATTATSAGAAISIITGAGNTSGAGGLLALTAGAGGATGEGGAVNVIGGAGGATSGNGGNVDLAGGVPVVGDGGFINLSAANGVGAGGNGGEINIDCGSGIGAGGGGGLLLTAGNAGTTGSAGELILISGNGGATSGDAGNICLQPGTASGSGADGSVVMEHAGVVKATVNAAGLDVQGAVSVTSTNTAIGTIQHTETLLSGLTGATVTATSLIPAGALVLGVSARVTTTITGATTFDVGDGADVDRWGTAIVLTAATLVQPADYTDNTVVWQGSAAGDVVLTANGSNFTAGAIRVVVTYMSLTAPTT